MGKYELGLEAEKKYNESRAKAMELWEELLKTPEGIKYSRAWNRSEKLWRKYHKISMG